MELLLCAKNECNHLWTYCDLVQLIQSALGFPSLEMKFYLFEKSTNQYTQVMMWSIHYSEIYFHLMDNNGSSLDEFGLKTVRINEIFYGK